VKIHTTKNGKESEMRDPGYEKMKEFEEVEN
jgi:hypothetical protein